ncbi:MAG TPA: M28 family peptidase [Asanoa sp.]
MVTPSRIPADRALTRPAHRAFAAVAAVAVLAVVGVVTLRDVRPPEPLGAAAPATTFSAARAHEHQLRIAARPHVTGGAANDAARDYLVTTLRGFGLDTSVQDAIGPESGRLSGGEGGTAVARVRNVVATLPGTASTGRVFLVAHYDSVQIGAGGNDDASGVSAIAETARALTAGARLRNDVVFLLTDAEEACLCGASAFASTHPLASGGGVVVNLEARGRTGPVIMFETSRNNAGLVSVFGRSAPHPVGTSFAVEIYRRLPNDTDFTAFLANGFTGINAAYIDGGAVYHTPLDTAGSVDLRSLQQHGDNALSLARAFGSTDLASLRAAGDATYFPTPFGLARYPAALTWPLAAAALFGVLALAFLTRRAGRTSWPRVAGGFGLALVPILVGPVAAQLLWAGVTAIRPGYAALLDPYRPLLWRLSVVVLSAAVLFGWYALFRRRVGPAALAIGGLLWLALIAVVLAAFMSGGSYLLALPAVAGAVAGVVALRARGGLAVVPVTLGAGVAVVVLAPTVLLLFPALGMSQGGAAALFAILLGLAALPVVDLLFPAAGGQRGLTALRARRWGLGLPVLTLVAALALAGAAWRLDRFDAAHPIPTQLMYALDADNGLARWLSYESPIQGWTSSYVDGTPVSVGAEFPALGPDASAVTGPAAAAALAAPALTTVSDTTGADGVRHLRVRVAPRRAVRMAALHVDAATASVSRAVVSAAGASYPLPASSSHPWSLGLVFHAVPPDGFELDLDLKPTTPGGGVRLRVEDASDGLSALPGFRARPPGVGIAGSHDSDLVLVAKTYTI